MSTTTNKRALAHAVNDAQAFRALFPSGCYADWIIAGSVRRAAEFVGDVEHVVVPRWSAENALFATQTSRNELWAALDTMVANRQVLKALYGATATTRWGKRFRAVLWRGIKHEIYTADADNFGAILAIRTGPASWAMEMVTRLRRNGFEQRDGYVFDHEGQRISVPSEIEYFRLAAISYVPPTRRRDRP